MTTDSYPLAVSDDSRASGLSDAFGDGVGRIAAPLREQVLNIVRQAIMDFQIRPGQRLIERELIEQLGVSRTTVRDVLSRLASEGLVTIIPQKGAIVSVLSVEEATDVYEMRAALEALAVRRFTERADATTVSKLGAVVDELVSASRTGDETDVLRIKDRFYEVLLTGARSPRLTNILTSLQGQVRVLRATSLGVSGRPSAAANEIKTVYRAIKKGDADKAADACIVHVRNAARIGISALKKLDEGNDIT